MTATLVLVFWSCAALVAYVYVGYPLLLVAASRLAGRKRVPPEPTDSDWPPVAFLIVAHNEEQWIEKRLENAVALDYPADRLEIVVASDGSTDRTVSLAQHFRSRGVRVLDFRERRGKPAVLDAVIPSLTAAVVALSDANTLTDARALRQLARWFLDPSVGSVCGQLRLVDPIEGTNADSVYWRYENVLKVHEGRLGALLGANGAVYALRRSIYSPLPPRTIIDDLVVPLLSYLRHGASIVFDPTAIAYEETPADVSSEFHRRVRIGTGDYEALRTLWPLLDPRRGWMAFCFLSHKVLRWTCPFFLIGMLVSSAALAADPLYAGLFGAQLVVHGLGAVLGRLRSPSVLVKPFRLVWLFDSVNAALLVGFVRWVRGESTGAWRRTSRSPVGGSPS